MSGESREFASLCRQSIFHLFCFSFEKNFLHFSSNRNKNDINLLVGENCFQKVKRSMGSGAFSMLRCFDIDDDIFLIN